MALDKGTETLTLATEEWTSVTLIETPKGGVPVATVHREIVRTLPDGTIHSKEPAGSFSIILTAEIAAKIEDMTDQWHAEFLIEEAKRMQQFEQRAREQEREDAAARVAQAAV